MTVEEPHINHPAPSKAAQNSELVLNQNSTNPDAIFNGRPTTIEGPPPSIYHPIVPTLMREYLVPRNNRVSLCRLQKPHIWRSACRNIVVLVIVGTVWV